MNYLDPKKQRAHTITLFIGYALIGIAILIATTVLLYRTYGFGVDRDGTVVQSGLVFTSSQPQDAEVYIDGKRYEDTTSARLNLPEGAYNIAIRKDGYKEWKRRVQVAGGSVNRYDYPLLIPADLQSDSVRQYGAAPALSLQSPDRRWILVQQPGESLRFDIFDVNDPDEVTQSAASFSIPDAVVSPGEASSWKLVEWSNDSRRVLLEHNYGTATEYILVDHREPLESRNLTRILNLTAGQVLSLRDKKFDRYYIFDPAAKTVGSVGLNRAGEPTEVTPVLSSALGFKSYGEDILLYATETGVAPGSGKIMTMLRDGDVTYKIDDHAAGGPYLLDIAKYDGDWYVAAGSSADNKVSVYKNPQDARKTASTGTLTPVQELQVTAPNYIAFSSNVRFIMAQNATNFALYDAETDKGYSYAAAAPIDAANSTAAAGTLAPHATWMDGHRLTYISGGKVIIFDYDNTNPQTLVASGAQYLPHFDRDYRVLYSFAPAASDAAKTDFAATNLLIEADR